MNHTKIIIILLWLNVQLSFAGTVFQWAVDVPSAPYADGAARAYLWIPENCKQVKAIVFAQHNMEEIQILADEGFRRALGEMGVAEVWCSPPWDLQFRFNEGADKIFEQIMNDLASKSGYDEIRHAPVIYMGHSAAASAPYYFGAWNPERTLAAVSVSGQWPYYRGNFAPDIWGGRNIDFIPCLETMGEYENALNWSAEGLKERSEHPLTPLSMLACPAEGHFASTPEKAEYIAFYIKKAIEYRLTGKIGKGKFPVLRKINPTKMGWLADKWRGDTLPMATPAPVGQYKGNEKDAFWFFDREHALRTMEYQSRHKNKKVQLLGYVQKDELVPQKNIHLQVPLTFSPNEDGLSFTLKGVFMDTVPGGSPRPANWAGQAAGTAIGHPASDDLIDVNVICGPVKKIDRNHFVLNFGRDRVRNGRIEAAFAVTHPGDSVYKPMIQQAELIIPEKITEGKEQTIIFPEIEDVIIDANGQLQRLHLRATSDLGLPVQYSVTEGPAVVNGNMLTFTPIPPRAKYPVEIRIEARQYGSQAKGIRSAENVIRTFHIKKRQTFDPVDWVNPFIDTHKSRWFFFSSASRPFGMVNLSPDTDTKGSWNSGYLYDSPNIRCFSHVHAWQMSGIAVMPTVGEFRGHKGMDAYQSKFNHEGEIAKPGYHKVYLSDYKVWAELTSTTRVGFHKYTFPKSEQSYILLDIGAFLGHGPKAHAEAWKVSGTEIAGYEMMERTGRRPKDTPVYFYAVFDKPFKEIVMWKDSLIQKKSPVAPERISGHNSGMAVRYETSEGELVLLKIGISYVSVEQAKKNLDTELQHWDFEQVKQESFAEWNEMLGRIEVEGGTYERKVKLYTDLWHALLGRRTISDADGHYMDMTGDYPKIRRVGLDAGGKPLFPHLNFDAWWGSHWSLNILWSLAYPEVMDAFCNTMIDMYRDGGLIPRGPSGGNYTFVMIGDPSAAFFASAYNKGIRNYDSDLMYEGLRKNAFPGGSRDHAGYEHNRNAIGGGMNHYIEQGYVPQDKEMAGGHTEGAAAMTMEYAYQDWCLAQLAKNLNKVNDYELFMRRSQNFRNLWNDQTGFIHPRNKDGSWIQPFDPLALKGFVESNSAIYSYFVPHDMPSIIRLMGGNKKFTERLDKAFERSAPGGFLRKNNVRDEEANWTDYGNQPGTGMAHLFNYSGAPWLTQYWVRRVKDEYGNITPYGGYKDDEDQGQMGALGVLMAIGLFEVDGGAAVRPIYEITAPLFETITIHLNNNYFPGEKFVIRTKNDPEKNMYIKKATLNGKNLSDCWFWHDDFVKGGLLELELGNKPNKHWGINPPSNN